MNGRVGAITGTTRIDSSTGLQSSLFREKAV